MRTTIEINEKHNTENFRRWFHFLYVKYNLYFEVMTGSVGFSAQMNSGDEDITCYVCIKPLIYEVLLCFKALCQMSRSQGFVSRSLTRSWGHMTHV